MGRLAALGCDPTRLFDLPVFTVGLVRRVLERAEKQRGEWSQVDATMTIGELARALK